MIPASKTCIVFNTPSKILNLPQYYYRVRSCDTNLTTNTPASQYQRLKLIQNTVRVPSSLYVSNLGPLSAYQNPGKNQVCWNQMSDRVYPSVQKTIVPTGSNSTLNKSTTSVTSSRPGCQSPGGVGCDIKHNSYDRFLNRLKAKGPLRRGSVPPYFGDQIIPFNPAFPVYGAKTIKTNIVSGCDCPVENTNQTTLENNEKIFNDPLYQPYPTSQFTFNVGDYVYALQTGNNYYTRALIQSIINSVTCVVIFDNGTVETQQLNSLLQYYPCNCGGQINSQTYPSGFLVVDSTTNQFYPPCLYPTYIPNSVVL